MLEVNDNPLSILPGDISKLNYEWRQYLTKFIIRKGNMNKAAQCMNFNCIPLTLYLVAIFDFFFFN